jgi:hypothetical protein
MRAIAGRMSHVTGCGWFWAWAFVGAALGFGVSAFGIFTVPLALIAVVLITRHRPIRGAFGLLSGVGAVLLLVAYLHRDGPGTTCWHTATAVGCDQHLNPIPWLVVGLICVVAGFAGHARRAG